MSHRMMQRAGGEEMKGRSGVVRRRRTTSRQTTAGRTVMNKRHRNKKHVDIQKKEEAEQSLAQ